MLPSRGISKANPASALRYPLFPTRAQLARPSPASTRSFSRSSIRSPSISSKHGLSRPTQIPQLASIGSGSGALGVASGVFAQRSGTTRNLSLWPFQSKPSEATAPPPVDTRIEPAASFAEPPTSVPDAQPPPVPVESVSPASAATPATPIDPSSTHLSHDSVFGDLDLPSILDIPEQIGYLKSLGLDFGWGPTSCVEWVLEHVYIYTGAPWWASLAMIAIVWRAALFMPTMTGSKHQALLQKAHTTPEFIKAKEQFNEAAFGSKDQMAMMSARASMSKITRQSGAQIWRPFVGFLTVPFSYGMFRLFRAMAAIPVPPPVWRPADLPGSPI
ncbi:Uu.00g007100.m01.CDS01 [Anthostomella pinea]|uniref:Uu.00g007100.m01.CDS01 n=1 Tax=Anthostomella pinea TaxID=933095 RepID=A0AAI8VLL1_9PEZI|nr:Uu.00g007100.m01.CDS01 [Anthostomella pinea]